MTATNVEASAKAVGETETSARRAETTAGGEAASARIVFADASPDRRDYIVRLLEQRWRVEAVADARAAMECVRREPCELVVSDSALPDIDGFELARNLRADPATAAVPILVLSAGTDDAARDQAQSAGIDDYLEQPFSARELLARVEARLTVARLQGQADACREQIRQLLVNMPFAVTVARGPDLTYEMVNDEARAMFGRDDLTGRTVDEAFPQAAERGLGDALLHVYRTGEPYVAREIRLDAAAENQRERYHTLVAQRMRGLGGQDDAVVMFSEDVTELVETRRRSDDLAAKATEDARRKDEFLAMLGHELRNPLAPIAYAVDLLKLEQESFEQPRLTRTVRLIDRQTKQLARLVDDLLDVSRITRGTVKLQKKRTTLGEVVASAVDAVRPLIDARRHRLTIALPERPVVLEADFARMSQVFANLLNNAAKYTPEGGLIRLDARAEAGVCTVEVTDNGIGIDADMLGRVFELFTQADESLDRAHGGLGVGLTVVQRLVEMHGGTVEALSEGLGTGSTFRVTLPCAGPDDLADRFSDTADVPRTGMLKVMIVDDNADSSESLAELLRMLGHEVATAASGDGALALVEGAQSKPYHPDVAFLDIGLPGMDGYELARRMRRLLGADVRLIALTGYGRDADQGMARAAGFDHHILKPADPGELRALLEAERAKRNPGA